MNYKELRVLSRRALWLASFIFCWSVIASAALRIEHTVTTIVDGRCARHDKIEPKT